MTNTTESSNGTDDVPTVDDADRGVFPRDSTWGHRIGFFDYESGRIEGHITPMVEEGETFGYQMESGKVGVFEITEVDRQLDPRDQFFGECKPVGYLEE